MILDERTELMDANALSTAGIGLALIGDVIDTSIARNMGALARGVRMSLVIQVTTAVTSAGAATVAFLLVSDAQAAIAVDGSASEHLRTVQVPKASLIAGYTLIVPVPVEGNVPYERYVGILQNVAVAALTAGAINAMFVTDVKSWKSYPDAL